SHVPVPATVTATDDCTSTPLFRSYSQTRTDGNCAGNYTLTRTWTATDACGNTTTKSQKITVTDTTAPTLSGVPTDTSADCSNITAQAKATATEACSSIALGVVYDE